MYKITELFVYRPIFMLELILAECFFFLYFKPRKGLAWRLPIGLLICFGFSFAIPILSFDSLYCSFMFLTMFMITQVLGVMICLKLINTNITVTIGIIGTLNFLLCKVLLFN